MQSSKGHDGAIVAKPRLSVKARAAGCARYWPISLKKSENYLAQNLASVPNVRLRTLDGFASR